MTFRASAVFLLVLACTTCGPVLPKPPKGPAPQDGNDVPYPPPAAAVEQVPPSPREDAVWMDGQWVWRGRYFVWVRGGWVIPPKDGYFAPPQKFWAKDGTLYYAEGTWRDRRTGAVMAAPPILTPAETPPLRETPETVIAP